MVTRKPVGPPLSTSNTSPKQTKASSNPNPPYPTTPTITTELDRAKTIHSAKSVYSPDLHTSPAFDLIGMNEARQRPRRDSDVSSHGTWDSGEEEEEEEGRGTPEEAEVPKPLRIRPSQQDIQQQQQAAAEKEDELPAILRPGPADGGTQQPRRSQESQRYEEEVGANPWSSSAETRGGGQQATASNNPYRQQHGFAPETSQAAWGGMESPPAQPAHGPPAPPVELPTMHTPSDELSKMSLGERRPREEKSFETAEILAVPQQGRPPFASVTEQPPQEKMQDYSSNNPWRRPSQENAVDHELPPSPPPGPPPKAPLQHEEPQYAPPPGPPPKAAAASTTLIDHQDDTPPASQDPHRPPPISTSQPHPSRSTTDSVPETPLTKAKRQRSEHYQIKHINWSSASSTTIRRSPILTQNANGPCPLLALVNALILSTPQNLSTALIETLRTREQVSLGLLLDAVFDELMSGRRASSESDAEHDELPDVGELYAFLLALHTGMNVNPAFVTPANAPRGSLDNLPADKVRVHPAERAQAKAGCFEETREMRLYSTFNIPLIHGWTAPAGTPAYGAFERSARTFEDAQNIQFLESELEDKYRLEGLGAQEQQTLQDIRTIKAFLSTWPTQLTEYGLETIGASLRPGEIAILFRNDHFSTLYREPRGGGLMTLVTDAGYGAHEEIVWESLVDVNGAASEMFSGDFRVVSHGAGEVGGVGEGGGGQQSRERHQRQGTLRGADGGQGGNAREGQPPPLPGPRPSSRQEAVGPSAAGRVDGEDDALGTSGDAQRSATEQEDHDLALALQLQEEEEDQHRQAEDRRRREQELSERYLSSQSNPTSPTSPEGPRPPIPPRRTGNRASAIVPPSSSAATPAGRPPVTRRPSNPDAPPSYEQSASDRPYRPAGSTASSGLSPQQGNPLSAYDALRRQQSAYAAAQQSTATLNGGGGGAGAGGFPGQHGRRRSEGNRIMRRSSQMAGGGGGMPGGYGPPAGGQGMPGGLPGRGPSGANQQAAGVRDAEERCVVM